MSSQTHVPAQQKEKIPLQRPRRQRLPRKINYFQFPYAVGEFFSEPTIELAQLCEVHPWLHELEKGDNVDLQGLRKEFLRDGHIFMSALGKFLDAKKWHEFVITLTMIEDDGTLLVRLLNYVFSDGVRRRGGWLADNQEQYRFKLLRNLDISEESQDEVHMPYHRILQAIKLRCTEWSVVSSKWLGCIQRFYREKQQTNSS